MSRLDQILMLAAGILLLIVNWLAFHDLRETYTVRDWLMLFASILVIVQFVRVFWNGKARRHQAGALE